MTAGSTGPHRGCSRSPSGQQVHAGDFIEAEGEGGHGAPARPHVRRQALPGRGALPRGDPGHPRSLRRAHPDLDQRRRGDDRRAVRTVDAHQHGRARGELAHRSARGQRQDLRRRFQAIGRDPRQGAARASGVRAGHSGAADAEGGERRDHHRGRRLRRASVRRLRRQRPEADGHAAGSGRRVSQVHSAVRRCRQSGRYYRRRTAEDLPTSRLRR